MKLLLIRLDKIGDLISTLPADELEVFKGHQVHWVISKGNGFLAEAADPPRSFTEIESQNSSVGKLALAAVIEKEKPDAAIVFYAPWWAGYTLWKKSVRRRIGRKSQWHSFLFFNETLRQSRSSSEKHESQYNAELVQFAFGKVDSVTAPVLKMNPPRLRNLFERFALSPHDYFVVHPGMAGSALNWRQKSYVSLIEKLLESKTVVVTGTGADDPWLTEIRPLFATHPKVRWLQSVVDLRELVFLLAHAKAVVAPSTGVLHMAASLGVKTAGIYSPLPAHDQKRWGPRGKKVRVFVPPLKEINSPESAFECMDQVQTEDVLNWVLQD